MWTSRGKQVAKQWGYLCLPLSCLNLTQMSPILFKNKRRRKESWGGKERATHTHGLRNTSGDHGSLVSSFFVCWFICLFVFSNFLQNRGEKNFGVLPVLFCGRNQKGEENNKEDTKEVHQNINTGVHPRSPRAIVLLLLFLIYVFYSFCNDHSLLL